MAAKKLYCFFTIFVCSFGKICCGSFYGWTPQAVNSSSDDNLNCNNNCATNAIGDCETAMTTMNHRHGVYLLKNRNGNSKPYFAACKRIDGKIWTIIQRRQDGSQDFHRSWYHYKSGFGNVFGEFWLGLDRLHELTSQSNYELRVSLTDTNGREVLASYKKFSVASEKEKYKLSFSGYSGTAGDSLGDKSESRMDLNGVGFSTYDSCNDNTVRGKQMCCSVVTKSGWWFNGCGAVNLNGPYLSDKLIWVGWPYFLKYVQMAIRRT